MATFITHDLGRRFLARSRFAPLGGVAVASPDATDQMFLEVLAKDCSYIDTGDGHGEKAIHAIPDAGTPFATVAAADHLYLVGGPGATTIAGGISHVASVGADKRDFLISTTSPYAGNIASGIVVMRSWRLCIALDARTEIHATDTIATMEAAEEDGSGYARKLVDPMDSASWTITQDTVSGKYQATAAQVVWTADTPETTAWQTNRNTSLIAFTGLITAPANEILIASYQFEPPVVALTAGQVWPIQFRMRFGEGV
jgi:hypothetical protein